MSDLGAYMTTIANVDVAVGASMSPAMMSPARGNLYIVQDSAAKTCTVLDQHPISPATIIIADRS
jgi:hypothetical protein